MTMTTASLTALQDGRMGQPDPGRPRRRTFTAEYKSAILDEYDQLPVGSPERGALLRREGLYTSHIAEWRKQRDAAALEGLSPKPRQRRKTPEQVELDKLRHRNAQLDLVPAGQGVGQLDECVEQQRRRVLRSHRHITTPRPPVDRPSVRG
jgi:hypothetical protein